MKKNAHKSHEPIEQEIAKLERSLKKMGGVIGPRGKVSPETHLAFLKHIYDFEMLEHNESEWSIDLELEVHARLDPPEDPDDLSDEEVEKILHEMIDLLARFHLGLDFTNHLSDRELYRKILTNVIKEPLVIGPEPKGQFWHHDCCPYDDDKEWPDDFPAVSDRDEWVKSLVSKYRNEPLPEVSVKSDG